MLEDEHVVTLSVFLDHFADIALVFANSQADLRTQELNSLIRPVFPPFFWECTIGNNSCLQKKRVEHPSQSITRRPFHMHYIYIHSN